MQDESLSNRPSDAATERSAEIPVAAPVQETLQTPVENAPEFGLIDVVEAFTSLRHEYRSQVKETRELASALTQSTQRIAELETVLTQLAHRAESTTSEPSHSTPRIAEALIEFDIQLSRAVEVAIAEDQRRRSRQTQQVETIDQSLAGLSRWRVWAARPVIQAVQQQLDGEIGQPNTGQPNTGQPNTGQPDAVIDGLSILLTNLRLTLDEHQIERIETIGKKFDGETMKSIGQLSVDGVSGGHVTEQLSPGYRHHGQIIQFATVRVAP